MATITASAATSSVVRAALARKPSVRALFLICSWSACNGKEGKTVGAATISSPALALVDERMSTEGTGLPFGLSNNLLVWILLEKRKKFSKDRNKEGSHASVHIKLMTVKCQDTK
ncbi:hypothetical protein OIU76_006805, partial [Salix suchowensis]